MLSYEDDNLALCHGDALDILRQLPENSVDSVVTDPPYALSFMGKDWDAQHPNAEIWKQCLRILKPGGHLLSFGGTRTWHRLACDIEDAGFEIRDNIAWLYGSGFPKSLDVSKAIDKAAGAEREVVGTVKGMGKQNPEWNGTAQGRAENYFKPEYDQTAPATDDAKRWAGWGTALKPAFEPIVVGRKPLIGTVAATVLEHGTGALNIDATRVGNSGATKRSGQAEYPKNPDGTEDRSGSWARTGHEIVALAAGRWPANVVLDECAAQEIDRQSGHSVSASKSSGLVPDMRGNNFNSGDKKLIERDTPAYGDSGGASRFFPIFKYQAKAPKKERPVVDGVAHPTVKPLELMRWLVRLVTQPGGWVLDPFAGSGTTAEAALAEGMRCILIEREAEYLPLIMSRLGVSVDAAE